MNRPYFYKNSKGELKRYYYCTFCGEAPFEEELQSRGTFFFRSAGVQPVVTCRACDTVKYPNKDRLPVNDKVEIIAEPVFAKVSAILEEPIEAVLKEVIAPKPILKNPEPVLKPQEPEKKEITLPRPKKKAPFRLPVKKVKKAGSIQVGQKWRDKDKRRNHTIKISRLDDTYAYYRWEQNKDIEKAITQERLKTRFALL